jgi:hypothetical protein
MNMTNQKFLSLVSKKAFFLCLFLLATLLLIQSCDNDDPEPEEEEELITTMTVTLSPQAGDEVILTFYDEDGTGPLSPEYTQTGTVTANTIYMASIVLLNESENPAEDITEEIEDEKDDHIFCFTVSGLNLAIDNLDQDSEGRDLGLTSDWETGEPSAGTIRIQLRHQPGTKTGDCPGSGSTDIDVTFEVEIE